MKKYLLYVLKLGVIIVLFYILFSTLDLEMVYDNIVNFNLINFIILVSIIFLAQLSSMIKFDILLKGNNIKISFVKNIYLYLISMFYNNFFIATLGGDSIRAAYIIKESKGSRSAIILSIILERIFGILAIFVATMVMGIVNYKLLFSNKILLSTFLIFALLFAMFSLNFNGRMNSLFDRLFRKMKILHRIWEKFNIQIELMKNRPEIFIRSLFLSLVFVFIIIISFSFINTQMALGIPFIQLLLNLPLILLISSIPISIKGLGLREWGMVYIFSSVLGYSSKENILSMSLIWFMAIFILSVFGGVIHLLSSINLKKI
ncbi:flippase-like domain-containing protein [bacterium]|nr:flippase-like domain-containing protein [bacterium]